MLAAKDFAVLPWDWPAGGQETFDQIRACGLTWPVLSDRNNLIRCARRGWRGSFPIPARMWAMGKRNWRQGRLPGAWRRWCAGWGAIRRRLGITCATNRGRRLSPGCAAGPRPTARRRRVLYVYQPVSQLRHPRADEHGYVPRIPGRIFVHRAAALYQLRSLRHDGQRPAARRLLPQSGSRARAGAGERDPVLEYCAGECAL